ncbi:hypothetical protein [Nocardia gipuzkoensis]
MSAAVVGPLDPGDDRDAQFSTAAPGIGGRRHSFCWHDPALLAGNIRKRTEMRLAAHAMAGALSTSKAVAQLFAIERDREKFHPAVIRHVQFPSLLCAGVLAAGLLEDAIRADRYEASAWDDLVVTTMVAQQLALGLTD